jgi:hypothetical protein
MSATPDRAGLTTEDVLAAIEELEPPELEKVAERLLHLQARRRAPNVSDREAELLSEIDRAKRPGFQERYDELNARRRAFALTPEEHAEFLQLVDESEAFTVRRTAALAELAQLRQTSLEALMQQLGLKAPPVA